MPLKTNENLAKIGRDVVREARIVHPIVREFEAKNVKEEKYDFRAGDTVRVSVRIVEGNKERVQDFEGVCIRRQGGGMNESFTVRRISYGVGMERIFPFNSPRIENVKVVRRGKVRRANLSYLRGLSGKKARITEDLVRSREDAKATKVRREAREKASQEAKRQAEADARKAEEAKAAEQAKAAEETKAAEATQAEATES